MKLRHPDKSPGDSFLIQIWNFVTDVISNAEFEKWVYEHLDDLKELLEEESFFNLICFKFSTSSENELAGLKFGLRDMIDSYPTKCECIKFGDYHIVSIVDSKYYLNLFEYVEKKLFLTFKTLKSGITKFSGEKYLDPVHYWVPEYFQDSTLYQCNECKKCWLMTLNESSVDYYLMRLSEEEAKNVVAHDQWPERSAEWFHLDAGDVTCPACGHFGQLQSGQCVGCGFMLQRL